MPSVQKIGRLALREEGTLWAACYAMPDTMDGAVFLGSVRMAFVRRSPERKDAFVEMMREAVADILEEQVGVRPTWPDGPRPAPAHERGGRG